MNKNIQYIDAEQFKDEVLQSPIPVIVDFFSDECPPCEVLAPIYEKLSGKYGDFIKFIKIHRQNNRELALSLDVNSSPTVLFFQDGQEVGERLNGFLNKPQVRQAIETILGSVIPSTEPAEKHYDLIILGAGAAGLSAALYAARSKLNTIVIDQNVPGGQAASTYHIANYPGTPGPVRGLELIANMRQQALDFGASIDDLKEIFVVDLQAPLKRVVTEDTIYYAPALIIATGAEPRLLPAIGADEQKGKGVQYCATCDGAMYEGRRVVVIGGGNSALEEAMFLTRYATEVTIIHQLGEFQAYRGIQDEVLKDGRIKVVLNSEVRQVKGLPYALTSVVLENLKTRELSEMETDGAFVYIGYKPASGWFKDQIDIDEEGYVKAGEDTQTSLPGVFSAGDIRTKPLRQVITAAADGAVAGVMAEKYLMSLLVQINEGA